MGDEDTKIIKLRGLPWNSTVKDILDFLKDCEVADGEKSVHLAISHRDGRPNGEAYVEMATLADVDKAFEYNKNVLGHRYIEIFNAKPEEFDMCIRRQNLVQHDTFIKLRGLPFSCKCDDIEQFFEGLEIRNGGICIVYDGRMRPTGEAFVQFCNSEDTDLAMKKNREKIGHRYIEIFRSSSSECRRSTIFNNPNNGRNSNGGGNGGGMNNFNNDRMGRMQRSNRSNFRDRPYDTPWSNSNNNNSNDGPWRNNNRGGNGGNNNGNGGNYNDNFGGGGGGGGGNGNNNMFNNDNFSSDFERNWSTGGNPFNSFSGGNGGGNNNAKNNLPSFDRDYVGFNNFSNNSNGSGGGGNGNSNFNNDRFNGGMNNSGGGGGGGCNQYAVHLRGMPYDCGENEVQQFFAPLKPVNVQVLYNNNGRHTGEADAYFSNMADAQEAMKKHKEKMGSRYIELFAKSNDRRGGGGGGNGGNGGRF